MMDRVGGRRGTVPPLPPTPVRQGRAGAPLRVISSGQVLGDPAAQHLKGRQPQGLHPRERR